ncbi:MAG: TerB family tellurite resistance protein [Salaquimonas sp.]
MFDALKSLFSADTPEAAEKGEFSLDDKRLCEAALMFHVIAVDGHIKENERSRMGEVLMEQYDLTSDEIETLFIAAEKADHEAVDLYRFTSQLKKDLDRDQRIAIIERMWEMVFADGKLHEFEDNVVWRVAQLLEVETQDRIAMKQRVRGRLSLSIIE